MRHDYRVRVCVEFNIDLSAETRADALRSAEIITESVFKQDYSRADDVVVDAREVKLLSETVAGHDVL